MIKELPGLRPFPLKPIIIQLTSLDTCRYKYDLSHQSALSAKRIRCFCSDSWSRNNRALSSTVLWPDVPVFLVLVSLKWEQKSAIMYNFVTRVVGHTDWEADRIVLLRMYRALVRSKLDYGCIVYGSARRSVLKQLDPVHHQGLRIALGGFPHISSSKSLREGTRTVFGFSPFKTVYKLCP